MKKTKKLFEEYIPLESEEQQSFIAHCELNGIRVISTQNGMYAGQGGGRFAYINKQKMLGLSKGFPDLIILAKNSSHEILIIEMKRRQKSKSKVGEDQKEWIHWLDQNDYCVGVAYGCVQAISILNQYLQM